MIIMDLSKRFKIFMGHSNSSNVSNDAHENASENAIINNNNETVNIYIKEKEMRHSLHSSPLNNPDVANDVLNSIDKIYFTSNESEESFDTEKDILEKLPQELDLRFLTEEQQKLKGQLSVVSKKVSELILKNQSAYAQELERVTQLQKSLSDAIKICTDGRTHLDHTKRDFICVSLGIVASYRRREILRGLLESLLTIKTLQETDIRLRELLNDDEDYSGAIQLYLECHKVVNSLKHYNCISELSTKLQDTLEIAEEQIDVALSKMCIGFNSTLYVKLQEAYKLLGKTETAMDQLLMHFASAIHNKAFGVVLGYVELFAGDVKNEKYHKKQYNELCSYITTEGFLPCFTDLCKALWDIMVNYYRILEWHRNEELSDPTVEDIESVSELRSDNDDAESGFNKRYVNQKLEHGLGRIWQDVQQKVRVIVQNHDMAPYNFEEFIKILSIAERMVKIGEEFCGNRSEELQDSLHKQTINYFQNYHRACMYELKMFLENETWTLCPVNQNFSFIHLQEFAFLKHTPINLSPNNSPSKKKNSYYFSKFFLNQTSLITPFDSNFDTDEDNDLNDNIEDINDEKSIPKELINSEILNIDNSIGGDVIKQKGNEIDSCQLKTQKVLNGITECNSDPIVTNATINVLRLVGKYMHMMDILSPIAFDVLLCIFHLFDYYLFSVYKFFGEDMLRMADNSLSSLMKLSLKRISENLLLKDNTSDMNELKNKYHSPLFSPVVDMSTPENLFGLAQRIVAVESLVVLSEQLKCLQSPLKQLIPEEKRSSLQQYFTQVVSIASDMRNPIYMYVAVKSIQYEYIVTVMSQAKWDIKEILSMHNNYVDLLLRELQIFSMRLTEVCNNQLMGIKIPIEARDLLWEHVLRLVNRAFIEGFSQAKKCTNEGRALMQLDYQQFLTKVETMVPTRPIPERELVEEYIKAYYLTEPALIQWIKTRKEYNPKQLISLASCVASDKKVRMRLISVIESEFSAKQ